MAEEKRFLVDVGMRDLPFPIRAASRVDPDGQSTVADISIVARILQEFEPRWIDKFIQIVHQHRDRIGTSTLRDHAFEYLKELRAATVKVDFEYPFFVEKRTPVSKEKCLVKYLCRYSARASSIEDQVKIRFGIEVPAIATDPASSSEGQANLLGQLSMVEIEIDSKDDIFPEDLVRVVDECALVPVYSFLTDEDRAFVIRKMHTESKTSVVMADEIRNELARNRGIDWYSVRCSNYSLLHTYSTIVGTEKSTWLLMRDHSSAEDYEDVFGL
jgi:GTP cyclohydrolase IB